MIPNAAPRSFCAPALAALESWHAKLDADDEQKWFRDQAKEHYGDAFWQPLLQIAGPLACELSASGRSQCLGPQLIGSPGALTADSRARGWHLDTVEVVRYGITTASVFPQFELIVGVYLTEMLQIGAGQLAAWPGSHHTLARWCANQKVPADIVPSIYSENAHTLGTATPLLGSPGTIVLMNAYLAHDTTVNRADSFSGRAYLRFAHDAIDRSMLWRSGDPWSGWVPGDE